jgi:hypothetical protein
MVSDETYTVCPGCNVRIEPDAPGNIYAQKMERIDDFGGSEYVEGMGGFFHAPCFPPRFGHWRQKEVSKAA